MPNPSEMERDQQQSSQTAPAKSPQEGLQAMLTWLQESVALGTLKVCGEPVSSGEIRRDLLTSVSANISEALNDWRMVEVLNTLTAERDAAMEEVITLHEEILKHERRSIPSARENYLHDEIARLRHELVQLESEKVRIELDLANVRGNYTHLAEREDQQRQELEKMRSIFDKPVEMLFADGRKPTDNECHLSNLLAWRQKEANEAKADVKNLQEQLANADMEIDRLDGVNEDLEAVLNSVDAEMDDAELELTKLRDSYACLAERVAAQSELLSRSAAKLGPVEVVLRKLAAIYQRYRKEYAHIVDSDNFIVLGITPPTESILLGDLLVCAAWLQERDRKLTGDRVAVTEDDGEAD